MEVCLSRGLLKLIYNVTNVFAPASLGPSLFLSCLVFVYSTLCARATTLGPVGAVSLHKMDGWRVTPLLS
mgnify:CR=1 FL=1